MRNDLRVQVCEVHFLVLVVLGIEGYLFKVAQDDLLGRKLQDASI